MILIKKNVSSSHNNVPFLFLWLFSPLLSTGIISQFNMVLTGGLHCQMISPQSMAVHTANKHIQYKTHKQHHHDLLSLTNISATSFPSCCGPTVTSNCASSKRWERLPAPINFLTLNPPDLSEYFVNNAMKCIMFMNAKRCILYQ